MKWTTKAADYAGANGHVYVHPQWKSQRFRQESRYRVLAPTGLELASPAGTTRRGFTATPRLTVPKICPIRDSVSEAAGILEFEEALPGHTLANGIIGSK